MLETLLTVFLAPLLINVLSELFKLWIKKRKKQWLTLLEGSKKPPSVARWGFFSYICCNFTHIVG